MVKIKRSCEIDMGINDIPEELFKEIVDDIFTRITVRSWGGKVSLYYAGSDREMSFDIVEMVQEYVDDSPKNDSVYAGLACRTVKSLETSTQILKEWLSGQIHGRNSSI